MKTSALIALYLGAIVLANVSFAIWGLAVEPWNSMLLIGLDLTARDHLHEAWGRRGLAWKMGLLILAGSALSALLGLATAGLVATTIDGGVVRVAIASAAGFGAAGVADVLTFGLLPHRWLRINGSNGVAALVDSFVFPAVAFGEFDLAIGLYFATVKIGGGALWWLALGGWREVAGWLGRPRPTGDAEPAPGEP
jgi:uncharacterized PurR-regulated membrane protein YhhQ (DUF165 family)